MKVVRLEKEYFLYLICWIRFTVNIHKCVCMIKLLMNDCLCCFDPGILPAGLPKIMKLVVRMESWGMESKKNIYEMSHDTYLLQS